MFLSAFEHLRGTVGFRLTLWYSGIFILSSVLLFGLAYFFLSSSLIRKDEEAIQVRLKELSALYQTGGLEYVEREVTIEKKFERRNPFFVRLAGRDNKTLLVIFPYQWSDFNMKELEVKGLEAVPQWIRLSSKGSKHFLEVASIRLAGGYLLQAGKSTEERERILRHFREIFAAVMIPLILCGFIGGAFLSTRALQPIRHVIDAIHSISTGRMDARAPSPRSGDELDELVILFNAMVEKIESLINGMRDTLDNVAHDLRTPMMRLRGIAEMALQSDCSADGCRESLADCLEESERILEMLDALMDISEAETGVMKLNLTLIDVPTMIDEVTDLYRYVAEDKRIELEMASPEDLTLTADPARLRQVLGNLIDNALKYTPEGGRVQVTAQVREKEVLLVVTDTGIGIPAEEISRIWDRLYRGDQSRSQKGLGLGLSLVRAIVRAHGGEVDVQSEPGKGSTFAITLPSDNLPFSSPSIIENVSKL